MYQVIWSDFAEQQVDDIYKYYCVNANKKVASKTVKNILLAPDVLIKNPKLGTSEKVFKSGKNEYRYIVVTNYKIIYTINEKNKLINVLDVFDTRQNPEKLNRTK